MNKLNKRKTHHLWTKLRVIKPWYLLIVSAVFALVFVFALRANYTHMTKLRDSVYQADQHNGDIATSLQNLRSYVYAHMNTNLSSGNTSIYPPIQLKYTYERLTQAAMQAATANNQQLYTDAQTYCQQQDSTDFSGRNRVPCITQYVSTHGVKITPVPDGIYKFDFISPRWSPDLAGWSLVLAILSFISFVILLIAGRIIRKRTR
jgi:hypothetical protein